MVSSAGGRDAYAHAADRARLEELAEDIGRQGAACRRSAGAVVVAVDVEPVHPDLGDGVAHDVAEYDAEVADPYPAAEVLLQDVALELVCAPAHRARSRSRAS